MTCRPWVVARLGALLCALTLTGCTSTAVVEKPSAEALQAQKKAAEIADCPASDQSALVADGLPDLTLECLGGGRSVRLAGLRGEPTMINIWGQWCPPCRAEAPFLTEVATDAPAGLRIIGVDYIDPRPDWAIEFAQLSSWTYPQLQDPDKRLESPLQLAAGIPQTLFVRADGTIAYQHRAPFRSAAEIRSLLRQHLDVVG